MLFFPGDGPPGISNVQCIGIENGLSACHHEQNIREPCSEDHTRDASAICTTERSGIRLVGGTNPYEGHIELQVQGESEDHMWGTVCDEGWDVHDAAVACRQMGFDGVVRIGTRGEFFTGRGPILLRYSQLH